MKVERIVECSCSILQYFWPALSDNWSSFLSGCLRQVLLYNQQSYSYMQTSVCVSVGKVYYPNVILFSLICLGPSFQKWPTIFCYRGHIDPPILKKIWSPAEYLTPQSMRKIGNLDDLITDLCVVCSSIYQLGESKVNWCHILVLGGIYLNMCKFVFGNLQWLQSVIKVFCLALPTGVKIARL